MNIQDAQERYHTDPLFHNLVDMMMSYIEQLRLTPTEIREAAMYAQMMAEAQYPELRSVRFDEHLRGRPLSER